MGRCIKWGGVKVAIRRALRKKVLKKYHSSSISKVVGLEMDKYKSSVQWIYSLEQLLIGYKGMGIEVTRSSDSATQEFGYLKATRYIDKPSILTFCGAGNGVISKYYNQKTGVAVSVPAAQRQTIVTAGAWVDANVVGKFNLEIPSASSLTVSGIAAVNRMKNRNMGVYVGFKGQKNLTGYSKDYVYPLKCGAGLMDFAIFGVTEQFWYDADGNISVLDRPGVNLVNAGNTYLFSIDMLGSATIIHCYNTGANYLGDLNDVPRLIYYLALWSCSNLTGDVSVLGNRLTYLFAAEGAANITGNLSWLTNLTYLLGVSGCVNLVGSINSCHLSYYLSLNSLVGVTGDLANLLGTITYLLSASGCSGISGVYTPVGAGTPDIINLANTGMTTANVDNTLIALDTAGKVTCTLTGTGLNRTAASDAAVTSLTGKGWTINGITKV
jgi:hypothetical protein